MENKYKYGLSRCAIAIISDPLGVLTYATPIAIPGGVNLTSSPKGDFEAFEADNTDYVVIDKNEGYEIELEIVDIPEAVEEAILILTEDSKKVGFESAGVTVPRFALLGQINGDAYNRRFTYFDCVLMARPEQSTKTSRAKEPQTTKLKIKARPREADNYVRAYTKSDTDATVYANWFTAVQDYVSGT